VRIVTTVIWIANKCPPKQIRNTYRDFVMNTSLRMAEKGRKIRRIDTYLCIIVQLWGYIWRDIRNLSESDVT
jgi:hypothetical protein